MGKRSRSVGLSSDSGSGSGSDSGSGSGISKMASLKHKRKRSKDPLQAASEVENDKKQLLSASESNDESIQPPLDEIHLEAVSEVEIDKKQLVSAFESNNEPFQPSLDEIMELKDMRKLSSNDEAFHLSLKEVGDVIDVICSRKTPTHETYKQWSPYAISFYIKMCTCYGVDHQHLEEDENGKKQLLSASESNNESLQLPLDKTTSHSSTEYTGVKKTQPSVTKIQLPSHWKRNLRDLIKSRLPSNKDQEYERFHAVMPTLRGPFKTGSYSSGKEPDRIPYHLYRLVKEEVAIKKRNDHNVQIDLETVAKKIKFFCFYFYSHLPTGWDYNENDASSIIANYDTMRKPKYDLSGYTPLEHTDEVNIDRETYLCENEIAYVMNIIHSRKTPTFTKLRYLHISFYYKLCSCFGIDYCCLEAASDDDVCLMDMGGKD